MVVVLHEDEAFILLRAVVIGVIQKDRVFVGQPVLAEPRAGILRAFRLQVVSGRGTLLLDPRLQISVFLFQLRNSIGVAPPKDGATGQKPNNPLLHWEHHGNNYTLQFPASLL